MNQQQSTRPETESNEQIGRPEKLKFSSVMGFPQNILRRWPHTFHTISSVGIKDTCIAHDFGNDSLTQILLRLKR